MRDFHHHFFEFFKGDFPVSILINLSNDLFPDFIGDLPSSEHILQFIRANTSASILKFLKILYFDQFFYTLSNILNAISNLCFDNKLSLFMVATTNSTIKTTINLPQLKKKTCIINGAIIVLIHDCHDLIDEFIGIDFTHDLLISNDQFLLTQLSIPIQIEGLESL